MWTTKKQRGKKKPLDSQRYFLLKTTPSVPESIVTAFRLLWAVWNFDDLYKSSAWYEFVQRVSYFKLALAKSISIRFFVSNCSNFHDAPQIGTVHKPGPPVSQIEDSIKSCLLFCEFIFDKNPKEMATFVALLSLWPLTS